MKARFLSTADLELKEAVEFYESARAGLGGEFLAEVEATTHLIESFPLAWTIFVSPNPPLPHTPFSLRPVLSSAQR